MKTFPCLFWSPAITLEPICESDSFALECPVGAYLPKLTVAAVNSIILPCNDSWTNEYSDPRFRFFRAQGLQTRLECLSHFTTSNPALWRFWVKISPLQPFLLDGLKRFSVEILLLPNLTLKLQLHTLHCSFGFIRNSPFAQPDASEMFLNFVLVLHVSCKVYLRSEDRAFYWSIYDSCWQDQMSLRPLRHDKRCGWFSKGAFHSTKYSGLKFRVFYATNGTVFSSSLD